MKLLPHQVKATNSIIRKLHLYKMCIFAGEVRSGKTLSFIEACKQLAGDDYLIITKKGAIEGIKKYTDKVTNYHQAKKIKDRYKVIVLDECHRYITAFPKKSAIWRDVYKLTSKAEYVIFASGTPTPETKASLYSMLALSPYTPWREYKTFHKWHDVYGEPYEIYISGGLTATGWDKVKEDLVDASIQHLVVSMTRKQAGHKYEPKDIVHHIPLTGYQQQLYNDLYTHKLHRLDATWTILGSTVAVLLQKLHQISGGFVNAANIHMHTKTVEVGTNKIEYIKKNFDIENTIILAKYVAEQEELAKHFPHTGSITKNSDGVDFSHFDTMVIYSLDYSATTYQQVIGRQLNFMTRDKEVNIHFLLSGIDEDIYKAVKSKKSFTSRWYRNNERTK